MHNGFAAQLARYGPGSNFDPPDRSRARYYCRRLATGHYENFSVASLLLPRPLVPHFHHVYAYCRWADDLADEARGGAESLRLLRWWRQELLACYDGRPRHPVMVALRETVEKFQIPPGPFLDLLYAFEQDQIVKRYATFEQLLGYCRYSANPVGHLVLYLLGSCTPQNAALADRVCTALQLANFWQDVGRDLDLGRVYLPEEDRQAFAYPDSDLFARVCTPNFAALMRYEVERARDLFYRGLPLVERLPGPVQADVELFIRGGLAILRKIERQGFNVLRRRPKLAAWDKGALVLQALVGWARQKWSAYRW
jgi:squalene synthase HpnC